MSVKNLNTTEKLIVEDRISLVISENCPFICDFCERDERRPRTIGYDVIDIILPQIDIRGEVHLSGGEVLSHIKSLEYLFNEMGKSGSKPSRISVATSGVVSPKKFEEFILIIVSMGVPLSLLVSHTRYHTQERVRLFGVDNLGERVKEYNEILRAYNFAVPDNYLWMLEEYKDFPNGRGVAAIGRGRNIHGAETIKRDFRLYKAVSLKGNHVKGNFQVQTDGRITPAIQMSWKEIDEHNSEEYSIKNKPLRRILER